MLIYTYINNHFSYLDQLNPNYALENLLHQMKLVISTISRNQKTFKFINLKV